MISNHAKLQALLEKIVYFKDNLQSMDEFADAISSEVYSFAKSQNDLIEQLNRVGAALSAEKNLSKLLDMILTQTRNITNADGGTLYLKNEQNQSLKFTVVETISLNIKMGGVSGEITWPEMKLYDENGNKNSHIVAAQCALTGNSINIKDVYDTQEFNFDGPKKFDASNNYRTKSMLVLPLKNHIDEIIGVLQLINRKDSQSGESIEFGQDDESIALSLASQAAIAITNANLVNDLEALLESFIKTIAVAIDEKSPYTGGHVRRMTEICMLFANAINNATEGKYKDITYNEDNLKEIYMAGWMHDVGKITTPEFVVDKSKKLETIYDRIESVEARAEIYKRDVEIEFLKRISKESDRENIERLEKELEEKKRAIDEDVEFLQSCNKGGEFMPDDAVERVQKIGEIEIKIGNKSQKLLSEDEIKNLTIRKGTLTDEERAKINDHAKISLEMLKKLPFPKKYRNIPEIAGAHHEKINGKGYPRGLSAEEITLEGRILAIADVFEALTAPDRPYKDPYKMSVVRKILGFMVKDGEIDGELLQFFYDNNLDTEYAKKELKPEQLDIVS